MCDITNVSLVSSCDITSVFDSRKNYVTSQVGFTQAAYYDITRENTIKQVIVILQVCFIQVKTVTSQRMP